MKKLMYLCAFVFLSLSCSQPKATEEAVACDSVANEEVAYLETDINESVSPESTESTQQTPVKENVSPAIIQKKIIKDGRMGLQVDNVASTKKQIDSLVKVVGGYYANENLRNSNNQTGYDLTIRIPVANFERFVTFAEKGTGKVLYKEIEARDVTEEFVDITSRLNSKRNSLARYNEILKKANTVKDIIEIEQSIRVLQEEIESSEGRLRYLNDCVGFSTLNLTISTENDFKYVPEKRDSFWEKLKEAVVGGWFGLVDFLLWFVNLWPMWLIITGIYFIIRNITRKIRKRKQQKKGEK